MKILKIGGSVLFEHHQTVAQALATQSEKLLVIIGYGPRLRLLSRIHGIAERRLQKMGGGTVRLTDDMTAAASYFASSIELNNLMSSLQVLGVACSSVYGSQGVIWGDRHAKVRYWDAGVLKTHDGDCSGRITEIDTDVIAKELDDTQCLVVSPLMRDVSSGRLLVCDADYAAVAIANSLAAGSLTIITDVPGFMVDGKVIRRIPEGELEESIAMAIGGMKKKLAFIKEGLRNGLKTVVVGDAAVLATESYLSMGTTFECAPRL